MNFFQLSIFLVALSACYCALTPDQITQINALLHQEPWHSDPQMLSDAELLHLINAFNNGATIEQIKEEDPRVDYLLTKYPELAQGLVDIVYGTGKRDALNRYPIPEIIQNIYSYVLTIIQYFNYFELQSVSSLVQLVMGK